MSTVTTCYISVGANQSPYSVDWGRNNLICFGACRAVVIYQPENGKLPAKVLSTWNGHKDKVNAVKWIRNSNNEAESEVVTGSVDQTLVVWKWDGSRCTAHQTLSGHSSAVISLDGMTIKGDQSERTLIVSTSVDSTVKIWSRNSKLEEFCLLQSICFGSGFCLDVALTLIPQTNIPLLACGGDDQKIHLYVEQNIQFTKVMTLFGHEDWIRGLDFTIDDSGDILLASCSQDYIIRIWRIGSRPPDSVINTVSIATLPKDVDIKMKENMFMFNYQDGPRAYAVSLESVMCGHDNWIYSIRWQPILQTDNGSFHQPMCLLSASMDKTMILWRPDPETGVWIEQVRVGEVGGNTLGLYGGMFSPDGTSILAHGYHGAFHQWTYSKELESWQPMVTSKGHFNRIEDLSWQGESGQFLLTVSEDQTTRLHAPWVKQGRPVCWYEVARPQVHGYDLQCMTMVNKYKMATGAEEKVIRVFDAPRKFLENLSNLIDLDLTKDIERHKGLTSLPEGASVPALGLSNKAVFQGDSKVIQSSSEVTAHPNEQYPEIYFSPVTINEPPTEEHLLQNALWPETQKLYGHGYEIFALSGDPSGKILASACKAAKSEYAGIILWDTETWKQICTLEGASLTVTRLEFSHSGLYLLSVSRDRTWRVYKKRSTDSSGPLFALLAGVDKKNSAHSRIIWSGAWSTDDQFFFTASRDKKVLPWRRPDLQDGGDSGPQLPCSIPLDLSDAVTEVACAPIMAENRYMIATGLDNGVVGLYFWEHNKDKPWSHLTSLNQNCAHHLTVKRLKFRPCLGQAGVKSSEVKDRENCLQLASCGSDWAVKIHTIDLSKLEPIDTS